jgi:hypothetical protein
MCAMPEKTKCLPLHNINSAESEIFLMMPTGAMEPLLKNFVAVFFFCEKAVMIDRRRIIVGNDLFFMAAI